MSKCKTTRCYRPECHSEGFNAATLLLTSAVRSRKSALSWGGYTGIETWQVLSDSLSREERWIVKIETLQDNPLEAHCSETEHHTLSGSFYLATPSAQEPCYSNSLKCLFKHVKDYVCGLSVGSSAAKMLFLKCCETSWDLRRSQRCWGRLEPRGMLTPFRQPVDCTGLAIWTGCERKMWRNVVRHHPGV